MYKHTQRSFAGGQIDRALMGRQDLAKYFTGASVLKNFLVRRQGNVAKRRGTDETCDVTGLLGHDASGSPMPIGGARLFPLTFDRDGGYHVLVSNRRAYLVSRLGVRAVTYLWNRTIPDYDGVTPYANRSTTAVDTPYAIGDTGYETLQDAFAAAQDGDTIKVGKAAPGLEEATTLSVQGTVTLDLNGNKIEYYESNEAEIKAAIKLTGATTLKITDSVGGGIITQPIPVASDLLWASANGSRIILEKGRVLARARNARDDASDGFRVAVRVGANAAFEGRGGLVANEGNDASSTDPKDRNALFYCDAKTSAATCSVTITGGLYRGPRWKTRRVEEMYGHVDMTSFAADTLIAASYYTDEGWRYSYASLSVGGEGRPLVAAHALMNAWTELDYSYRVRPNEDVMVDGATLFGNAWDAHASSCAFARCEFAGHQGEWSFSPGEWQHINQTFLENVASGTTRKNRSNVSVPTATEDGHVLKTVRVYPAEGDPYLADWDATDDHWAPPAQGGGTDTTDRRPFYTAVPWDDADLAELNFCQSGDTIMFAHRNYPPSKIVFDQATCTIAYSEIDFSASAWQPPVVTGVSLADMNKPTTSSSSSSTTTTTYDQSTGKKTTIVRDSHGDETSRTEATLAKRTVQYAVSYVKDGVESPPSAPVSATYLIPWAEGDKIRINFSKGGNAAKPDQYRIYKKQGTEFGLIGTVNNSGLAKYDPKTTTTPEEPTLVPRGSFDGRTFTSPSLKDVVGRAPNDALESWSERRASDVGTAVVWPGIGGAEADDMTFSFGSYSNCSVAKVNLRLDTHSVRYETREDGRIAVFDDIGVSGTRVTCVMRHRSRNGSGLETTTKTLNASVVNYVDAEGHVQTASQGVVTHHAGVLDTLDSGRSRTASLVDRSPRSLSFNFSDQIAGRQTVDVRIYAQTKDGASWKRVPLRLSGVSFHPIDDIPGSFDDDYITPDMSNTPVSPENPFVGMGNYPSCVGIHQQRLVYASSRNDPTSVHMSATGDLANFSPHSSIREDDPISMSIAATEFPDINHVVVTRDIILLADGGEWKVAPVSGNTLTYKTVSCSLQTRNGSSRSVKPMAIGDEVVYADASGQNLLATRYNYASDGYESMDLTVLAHDIFDTNRIVQAAYEQFPDSRVKCALADGRVAVLVYMKEHEVAAWSVCTFGGGARAMGVSCSRAIVGNTCDTCYVVKSGDSWRLWSVRPESPEMTVAAQVTMDGVRHVDAAAASDAVSAGMTAVDATAGTVVREASEIEEDASYFVGWPFEAELVTVRPEPQGGGTIQFELKNAKDVELRVIDSGSWRAAPLGLADDPIYAQRVDAVPVAREGAVALDSRDHRLSLTGSNGADGRVQIKSDDVWPMAILSVSTDYEIQPLSNSEG